MAQIFAKGFGVAVVLSMLSSPVFGAKVLSMKPEKGVIVLDEGKAGGFVKGGDVCIYDASDAELVCGKVTSVTAKNTSVRVPPDKMTGVEKGLTAKLKDPGAATVAAGVEAVAGVGKKKGKGGKASNKYMRNFKLMYVPGLVPAPFAQLSFGVNKDTGVTDYKEIGNNSFGLIGLGLEYETPVGAKTLAIGFRYRIFPSSTAQADLSKTVAAHYYETQESGTAMGLWFDYYFLHSVIGKSTIFKLGSGLDIDQSLVKMTITPKTDGAALPATATDSSVTSKTGVISLRIPVSLLLFFDPIGINLDVVPMLPLVEQGSSIASTPESSDSEAANEFKKTTLKHKKASIAADIRLGVFFAF